MAYSKNRRLAEIVSDTSGNLSVEGIVVPTQSNSDNDTSAASTAFVHAHIDAVLDSAPGTLNTLNEIAAALNDDANFNTTVTNSIAAKLPLAGGTMTGNLTVPYLATTSYIDLNNSGNRGKIGWSGNHTYIATSSSVGAIIFKNNVSSTASPQTGGDTLLTIADGGNATFTGTITSSGLSSSSSNTGTNPAANGHIASELQFYNGSATDNNLNGIGFYNSNSAVDARIAGVHKSHSSRHGEIAFLMHDGSALTERVRFDKDGKVGIGTGSPSKSLSVKAPSGSNGGIDVFHNNGNKVAELVHHGSGDEGRLSLYDGGTSTIQLHGETGQDSYIDSGNVGIGTTSPGEKLEVDGIIQIKRTGDHPAIRFMEDGNTRAYMGSGDWAINGGAVDDFGISASSTGDLLFGTTAGVEKMRITNGGKVGIGQDTPIAKLHIRDNTSTVYDATAYQHDLFIEKRNTAGNNQVGTIRFGITGHDGSTTAEASIGVLQTANAHSGNIVFGTRHSGTRAERMRISSDGKVGIGTGAPPSQLSIFGQGTSSPIAANAQQAYDNGLFRINNFGNSSVGLSIGSTGSNWTHLQTSYNEGTTAPLALNPFGGGVYIGTNAALFSGGNLTIFGSADAGGGTQNIGVKNTTTASFSSTAFVGTGRVLDFFTNSNNNQDFSAIRFTNPEGNRETALAVVQDSTTTRDGTGQGDVVIQGYDGDGYIETQRFRANGASSSTGQRRTGSYTSFAYINHTYTFDHAGYSTAGTPANSNDHWLEVPLYSSYSTSAGGGWVEIDICWHATHAQAAHLHSYKLLWGSNHTRILNVSVVSSSANATSPSYNPYTFTSSSQLFRHPTSGDAYMSKMYIEIKGSTNHSGARSITLRGVGHPSVKNIAPVIDHGSDSTPDGITPANITSAITATG